MRVVITTRTLLCPNYQAIPLHVNGHARQQLEWERESLIQVALNPSRGSLWASYLAPVPLQCNKTGLSLPILIATKNP